jgi:hypothetical protein
MYGPHQDDIGAALDSAARHCPEDRERIADYVTFTMEELNEKKPSHGEDALHHHAGDRGVGRGRTG